MEHRDSTNLSSRLNPLLKTGRTRHPPVQRIKGEVAGSGGPVVAVNDPVSQECARTGFLTTSGSMAVARPQPSVTANMYSKSCHFRFRLVLISQSMQRCVPPLVSDNNCTTVCIRLTITNFHLTLYSLLSILLRYIRLI